MFEYGLRDGAGGDTRGGLAGGGTAATFNGADAVLGVVREVGVRRTIGRFHLGVGLWALVAVADDDGDGRAEGEAVMRDAREDFRCVGFFALRGQGALARATAVEFAAQESGVKRYAGRAAINDDAECGPVAFAEGGDAETVSVCVAHW